MFFSGNIQFVYNNKIDSGYNDFEILKHALDFCCPASQTKAKPKLPSQTQLLAIVGSF